MLPRTKKLGCYQILLNMCNQFTAEIRRLRGKIECPKNGCVGSNCQYQHTKVSDKLKRVCKYFKRNECKYESGCAFSHEGGTGGVSLGEKANVIIVERPTLNTKTDSKVDKEEDEVVVVDAAGNSDLELERLVNQIEDM